MFCALTVAPASAQHTADQHGIPNMPGMSHGAFRIGADIKRYAVPENLREPYGSPASYHVFVHYAWRGYVAH